MRTFYAISLLVCSNIFMTFAWYGHLKLREMKLIDSWPMWGVILLSWGIALAEYCFQVPANTMGFKDSGGSFSLVELKVIQEVVTLVIFTLFVTIFFKNETLRLNHLISFGFLILAVYFAFKR